MIEIWKVNKSHMYFFCFQSQETNHRRTLPLYVCTVPCHSLIPLCQEAQSSLQKAEFGCNAKSSFQQSSRRFHGCQFWVTSSHNSIQLKFLPLCCLLIRIKSGPQIGTTISTPYFDDLTNILINQECLISINLSIKIKEQNDSMVIISKCIH